MSRTFRRKRERHEYYWVLHDWESRLPYGHWVQLDPNRMQAVKQSPVFIPTRQVTMGGSAPRWYRKVSDHRIRTSNDRMLRRWLG